MNITIAISALSVEAARVLEVSSDSEIQGLDLKKALSALDSSPRLGRPVSDRPELDAVREKYVRQVNGIPPVTCWVRFAGEAHPAAYEFNGFRAAGEALGGLRADVAGDVWVARRDGLSVSLRVQLPQTKHSLG